MVDSMLFASFSAVTKVEITRYRTKMHKEREKRAKDCREKCLSRYQWFLVTKFFLACKLFILYVIAIIKH